MRFGVTQAECGKEQVIVKGDVRISVISNRILRVEKGGFTDKKTQIIDCRNFANPKFTVTESKDKVSVKTENVTFNVYLKSLKVGAILNGNGETFAENRFNLGGTARTLDGTFGILGSWKGKVQKKDHFCLGHIRTGIFAENGVSEIDDSKSVLLNEDGSVEARKCKCVDKYVLAFGDDYFGGLKEYYRLTGATPILPKFALSNWWSRYHAYTDKEYLALMDKFIGKKIPLTVATVDMDWHIVKNVPKGTPYKSMQGAGWTGYTFEKELFPDYKAFLRGLKDRGLAVTMNLHPRDGVRAFEQQYEDMARACGIDPATKQPVEFDLTDRKFLNAYFDILHHPYEADGVDFWWIDWQQGTKSKMDGLDPLWLLNHYHYLDNCRDGKHGLILSRYAGLGSHRYPIGFSGDTLVCWKSLRFQPYFTALASNAGYTWWSHDIGGHMFGKGNEELYVRWLQFGVFSPINRLHSNNKAWSKEPWLYTHVENIAENFLRLRHSLLPYIYSANILTATEGKPIICPLYYYSKEKEAREKKWRNEYFFGENMLVAPVTKKGRNGVTSMQVWLPKGEWTDFFTGKKYSGGVHQIDCPLNEFPVFVKSGSIIPMLENAETNSLSFENLQMRIYPGDCEYTLHDDDSKLHFTVKQGEGGYVLTYTASENCKTKHVKVIVEGNGKGIEFNVQNGETATLNL